MILTDIAVAIQCLHSFDVGKKDDRSAKKERGEKKKKEQAKNKSHVEKSGWIKMKTEPKEK